MTGSAVDVSVIVAVHNRAATLAQCVDSVLAQTGCTVELIVVDAMSNDGTQAIVESYGDSIAKYIREPDSGIYDAWNKALAVTRGEWCAFLGADDYFLTENSISSLLESAHQAGARPVFVYGGLLRVGAAEDFVTHPDPRDPLQFLRSGRMLPHPGSLHRVHALRDIGGFDATYQIVGDFVAVLELTTRGEVTRCPKVVTAMRIGGMSGSWSTSRRTANEMFVALKAAVGLRAAVRRHITDRWPQIVARVVEQAVLAVLGQAYGTSALIRLRRSLGRPPKLI